MFNHRISIDPVFSNYELTESSDHHRSWISVLVWSCIKLNKCKWDHLRSCIVSDPMDVLIIGSPSILNFRSHRSWLLIIINWIFIDPVSCILIFGWRLSLVQKKRLANPIIFLFCLLLQQLSFHAEQFLLFFIILANRLSGFRCLICLLDLGFG